MTQLSDEVVREVEKLREWRDAASLTLSDLREQLVRAEAALKRARPWLSMVATQRGRPVTSAIHAVLSEVDAALCEANRETILNQIEQEFPADMGIGPGK